MNLDNKKDLKIFKFVIIHLNKKSTITIFNIKVCKNLSNTIINLKKLKGEKKK
jgi:hypothetical protein